jgi:hypothetical protein
MNKQAMIDLGMEKLAKEKLTEDFLTDNNVYVGKYNPTPLHKKREEKPVALTNVYSFDDEDTLENFKKDLKEKGFGKDVWGKYDKKGDLHSAKQYRSKPFLLGRKKYKNFTENPMTHVFAGLKDKQKKMLDDAASITLGVNDNDLKDHLNRKSELVSY